METEPPLLGGDGEKKPPLGMELVRKRGIVLSQADILKWGSLLMLVLQNSALFVITRYTRSGVKGRLYLTSVVVLIIELSKMAICLVLLLREGRWRFTSLLSNLYQNLWIDRSTTLLLAVPATCYAIQNNLIFVAISNLSAAAAQVLYQLKSLSTAFFTVVLLHRTFSPVQWISFVLLTLGVVLVQSEDAKSSNTPTGASPLLGVVAALAAATLSGFAGVFLEKMFPSGARAPPTPPVCLRSRVFALPVALERRRTGSSHRRLTALQALPRCGCATSSLASSPSRYNASRSSRWTAAPSTTTAYCRASVRRHGSSSPSKLPEHSAPPLSSSLPGMCSRRLPLCSPCYARARGAWCAPRALTTDLRALT